MTSALGLVEGARRLVGRGTDLDARLTALEAATTAARGRLDDGLLDLAGATVTRAAGRLRLSADHTVVALAGATGSGKSSTFNALTGLDLSTVGVRRPTTSTTTACVWGDDAAPELLEWLGIAPRHQNSRGSLLDTAREGDELDGVVLLDLPDHDSTEVAHHLEVDRLVDLADLLVWVVDPQKYADAAIHERYLRPLSTHAEVMVVVLNHVDTVAPERRAAMVADLRRLLEADGLRGVPVLTTSARTGEGMSGLRAEIARRVAAKRASRQRLEADVRRVSAGLAAASGDADVPRLSPERVDAAQDALAEAAGVPTVVDAVRRSTRRRAQQATGWPVVSWVSRLRPDPLRRLHLDLGRDGRALTAAARTSVPTATAVQRARVDSEVRRLADDASAGLARPWVDAVRRASTARMPDLVDRLDAVVGGTDLGPTRVPLWAGAVRVLQWVLLLAAVVGLVWSGLVLLSGSLGDVATPEVAGLDLPLLLLVGGVLLGVLLALVCRVLVAFTARRRAAAVDRRLRAGVRQVGEELLLAPVAAELAAYAVVRDGLRTARR